MTTESAAILTWQERQQFDASCPDYMKTDEPYMKEEIADLRAYCAGLEFGTDSLNATIADLRAAPVVLVDRNAAALNAINEIRNSIIGLQSLNWSEHVYPLVAALDAAGYEGMEYPEARENYGTLLERAVKAEDELAAIKSAAPASVPQPAVPQSYGSTLKAAAACCRAQGSTKLADAVLEIDAILSVAPAVQDAPAAYFYRQNTPWLNEGVDAEWRVVSKEFAEGLMLNQKNGHPDYRYFEFRPLVEPKSFAAPVSGEVVTRPDLASLTEYERNARGSDGVPPYRVESFYLAADVQALFAPDQTTGEKQ